MDNKEQMQAEQVVPDTQDCQDSPRENLQSCCGLEAQVNFSLQSKHLKHHVAVTGGIRLHERLVGNVE